MQRRALIIGIATYEADPLENTIRDAKKVAEALSNRGFDCTLLMDATALEIENALDVLTGNVNKYEISLIYFAGHAVEHHGAGYILPKDFTFPAKAAGLEHFALSIARLLEALAGQAETNILILDACRNWPELTSGDAFKLTAQLDDMRQREGEWDNVMVVYSTSSGDTASDGRAGASSVFCDGFCNLLLRHDLTLDDCFKELGSKVISESSRKQRPWYYSSLRQTSTFSDLRKFDVVQSYAAPLNTEVPLWMSPVDHTGNASVTGGARTIFAACFSGLRQIQSPRVKASLVAGCLLAGGVALLTEEGILIVGRGIKEHSLQTKFKRPFGIFECHGEIIAYGFEGWGIYLIEDDKIIEKDFRKPKWTVHTGTSTGPSRVCLAGSFGNIIEVTWNKRVTVRQIETVKENINSVSLMADGHLLCGGDSGMLLKISPTDGKVIANYARTDKLTTIARRWQSLASVINDNEPIMRFLTRPDTLPAGMAELLEKIIDHSRVMCADSAPHLPLIASGTDEGIIELIDTRDGQTFQRIDVEAGTGLALQGLRFISDTHFVTLSETAVVRHYMSGHSAVTAAGPFLTEEQDRMLLAGEFDLS